MDVKKNHWVMDYETITNCFVAVFIHYKDDSIKRTFVINETTNDFERFYSFLSGNLKHNEWHISYNGLAFDAQITQYILSNKSKLSKLSGDDLAKDLYAFAQDTIQRSDKGVFLKYAPFQLKIRQIDLFKLNHWDNKAKMSSLKWIQYSMDWQNVEEMPHPHYQPVTSTHELNKVVRYCVNDVMSTKKILQHSKEQITLRQTLTTEYGIDLYSASEPRISKELFLHFLTNKLQMDKAEIKTLRTPRSVIDLGSCILPYVSFETSEFQKVYNYFKSKVVSSTKDGFKFTIKYKGVQTDYGLGGIHGSTDAGVYEAKPGWTIMTSDVTSFYPNLAIRNKWAPAHLPKEEFCNLYEWFFEERKKIPKKDPKNYVYKIILNSTYGLSNDENSFLYDPEFTMRITINGQLSLTMLYEMICEEIPNALPLMQNTDGLETMIPKQYEDKYMEICRRWEKITNLQLEHDKYSKIILGDVNNYIAITEDGKSKCKGRFEFANLAMHKNKSFLVIPRAIHAYFVDGIKPEDYIKSITNIFDFCGGVKIKGDWSFYEHKIAAGDYSVEKLQHTIRYFISKTGSKVIKKNNTDNREIQIEAGKWLQTLMIDYEDKPFSEYDINYDYYLDKINKEIRDLEPIVTQLTLF